MTPGLWHHRWRPTHFVLIVDDFGVEYVKKKDTDHLQKVLKTHHKISQDWEGKNFSGINLEWNYAPNHADQTCCLSMKHYISDLLIAIDHPAPRQHQLSPHRCKEIQYGSKVKHAHEEETSTPLEAGGIRPVKQIVGALLWVGHKVNNKLLVALSAIDGFTPPINSLFLMLEARMQIKTFFFSIFFILYPVNFSPSLLSLSPTPAPWA